MGANIPSVNRRKSLRRRNRRIIVRLILLQLVMLAVASHYAHAQLYGIIKYYILELCTLFLLMCGLVQVNDVISKRKKTKSRYNDKKPLQCCPVDEVDHTKDRDDEVKVYNYNWIIKDESKSEVVKEDTNECEAKEELPKQVYKSPFDEAVNTDKKVVYKSPFDSIGSGNRVMIVLDSARDDDRYVLSRSMRYRGVFHRAANDRYVLSRAMRYRGVFHRAANDRYVLSRAMRYRGVFHRAANDRYVLSRSMHYCGRFLLYDYR